MSNNTTSPITSTPSSEEQKGNQTMPELEQKQTETTEQSKGRALPYQDLRTVPLNTLLRKVLARTASKEEHDQAVQRMCSIHADIYADKRFDSKKRASMQLWTTGIKDIVQARRQNQQVNLMNLLGEHGISEFMDHNPGNQEHLARFSALDLANIAVGFRDPEDRYKPWTRGLYVLSERFTNYGIVFAGPSEFALTLPANGKDAYYALSGDDLYDLLSHAIPQTIQPAPGTTMCVMNTQGKGQVPGWDAYTMVIPAGTEFHQRLEREDQVHVLQHDIRATMPNEIYSWIMLSNIDVETVEHQNPQTQADMRRTLKLRTKIVEKKLGGRIPQNQREMDYAQVLLVYTLRPVEDRPILFTDGHFLKGLSEKDLESIDAFIGPWTDRQAARAEQKKIREENRAKEKEEQRAKAIAYREARESGNAPRYQNTQDEQPIATGSDLLEEDMLP